MLFLLCWRKEPAVEAAGRTLNIKPVREVVLLANEKNLIPFNERSKSEQREIQSKGGIASGVARRRKKSLKEAADYYLSLPVADRRRWNKLSKKYIDPDDIDNQMAMIVGLTEAATKGNAPAANVIISLLGIEEADSEQLTKAKALLEDIDSAID